MSIIERAMSGNKEAFGELYRQYRSDVYVSAYKRLRDPYEAEELTQEVFLHVLKKLPQLRDMEKFPGWLRRITLNKIARWFRQKTEALHDIASDIPEPLDELIHEEEISLVDYQLSELKPIDRKTLEAFYVRGLRIKQIAKEFAVPIGTVKRRLFVARERLGKRLAA